MQLSGSISEITDPGFFRFRILGECFLIIYMARNAGRSVDKQYREPEGKPKFIRIPENRKWMFSFEYFIGPEVVREGLALEVFGYLSSAVTFCLFILACFLPNISPFLALVSDVILYLYTFLGMLIVLPMSARYSRNLHQYYDSDWITSLQRGLTQLPKRRCKVKTQLEDGVYEITLGTFGRRKHLARSSVPVSVGDRMYAVHSYDHGFPFWTIRDH